MNNGQGKGTRGQNRGPNAPADDDLDIEDLREAAERAWRDRWGIPDRKHDRAADHDANAPEKNN